MSKTQSKLLFLVVAIGLLLAGGPGNIYRGADYRPLPRTRVERAPDGGIQPQTAMDARGGLHMIYFTGDAGAGDIFYVRRNAGATEFSRPLRVNTQPGSAVAVGTVRGPQMALGADGRVYVVWFGSDNAQPRGPGGAVPVLFSRLNDAGTAFEPQRCVMQYAKGVDGGLSVAAGTGGDVYVVWHADGSEEGEAHRRVYLARSTDEGRTFVREVPISPAELGACGCCGMRAMADRQGKVYVFYRAAAGGVNRDMTLLESDDRGSTFRAQRLGPWKLNACPMSTASLSALDGQMLAAWETDGQIHFDKLTASQALPETVTPPGAANDRKHPAVAIDARGWVLLAWTEGTGWEKGGALAWQMYDPSGKPAGAEGHAEGVPVWDLPSVVADRQGNFVIAY